MLSPSFSVLRTVYSIFAKTKKNLKLFKSVSGRSRLSWWKMKRGQKSRYTIFLLAPIPFQEIILRAYKYSSKTYLTRPDKKCIFLHRPFYIYLKKLKRILPSIIRTRILQAFHRLQNLLSSFDRFEILYKFHINVKSCESGSVKLLYASEFSP